MNITENHTPYPAEELFRLAKRENNAKRGSLIVNLRQGKHVPVSPSQALELFDILAERVCGGLCGEKVLVAGFAETATAIGAELAARIGGETVYIHTTREKFPPEMRLADFSEEHSHAAEQNLYSSCGRDILKGVDRIIFAEDELTTGKTILNFISALGDTGVKYAAASIINGMSEENLAEYKKRGIDLYYAVKTESSLEILSESRETVQLPDILPDSVFSGKFTEAEAKMSADPRLGVRAAEYERECASLFENIRELIPHGCTSIDVVGTQECMYPAIKLGAELEKHGFRVRTHSTTRSPIVPSAEENYPLFSRYRLRSLYDSERRVYLYNLYPCGLTVLVTDAKKSSPEITEELMSIFKSEKKILLKLTLE